MKKLLFLLLQAFLCLGSAKDAGPSSLGRGYGAGNSAVSAQSSLSGDQKARLADVIYLTGVGPMIYQDFIKFWDGQKAGDFLQSVVHLAQQYSAGNINTRDQYWTEIFTYLLQREPQLYEALKRFPRVSGFINANAEYFDEVVKTAKENIAELDKMANDIFSNIKTDYMGRLIFEYLDIKPIIDFIKKNNISVRKPIYIQKRNAPLFKLILTSNNGLMPDILELGEFGSDIKNDDEINRRIFDYIHYDAFKMLIDRGFVPTKDAIYKIIRGFSGILREVSYKTHVALEDGGKLRYLLEKGFKYPIRAEEIILQTNSDEYRVKHNIENFINTLISIGMENPENLLNNQSIYNNLYHFTEVEEYLDKKGIKYTIKNNTYEKANEWVKKYLDKNYIKIGDSWLKKGSEDTALKLFGQQKQPTYPNRGIIFNR